MLFGSAECGNSTHTHKEFVGRLVRLRVSSRWYAAFDPLRWGGVGGGVDERREEGCKRNDVIDVRYSIVCEAAILFGTLSFKLL